MALGWLGGSREQSLPELIAQKKYARAIELLRAQLQQAGRDPRVRMQLADVLDAAGRRQEAIPIYLELADRFARDGYVAKAIALFKKIERIEPGRKDVAQRLEQLAVRRREVQPAISTATIEIEEIALDPSIISAPRGAGAPVGAPASVGAATPAPGLGAPTASSAASPAGEQEFTEADLMLEPEAAPQAAAAAAPAGAEVASEAEFEEQFFAELTRTAGASGEEAAPAGGAARVKSPLFDHFTDGEFLAVAARLDLVTFEAGDIVISEGEPGDSLFVLTEGVVKAFVRNAAGRSVLVREMGEGSFFGEISILSGKPRTATVTCASHCELLELDRNALAEITRTQPRVQQVLEDFYRQRHGSGEETLVRGATAPTRA